MLPVLMPK